MCGFDGSRCLLQYLIVLQEAHCDSGHQTLHRHCEPIADDKHPFGGDFVILPWQIKYARSTVLITMNILL